MDKVKKYAPTVLILYIAFVFIQSLFFKFADAPETQHIFNTLNTWAVGLGLPGVFAKNGIFSQYVIGSAELVASTLLLASLVGRFRPLRLFGALLTLGIISGAIVFHLFTPLGVVVEGDGGLLFGMAVGVWLAAAYTLKTEWQARRSTPSAAVAA